MRRVFVSPIKQTLQRCLTFRKIKFAPCMYIFQGGAGARDRSYKVCRNDKALFHLLWLSWSNFTEAGTGEKLDEITLIGEREWTFYFDGTLKVLSQPGSIRSTWNMAGYNKAVCPSHNLAPENLVNIPISFCHSIIFCRNNHRTPYYTLCVPLFSFHEILLTLG